MCAVVVKDLHLLLWTMFVCAAMAADAIHKNWNFAICSHIQQKIVEWCKKNLWHHSHMYMQWMKNLVEWKNVVFIIIWWYARNNNNDNKRERQEFMRHRLMMKSHPKIFREEYSTPSHWQCNIQWMNMNIEPCLFVGAKKSITKQHNVIIMQKCVDAAQTYELYVWMSIFLIFFLWKFHFSMCFNVTFFF